jgi:dTDP-4-dehydrorhamnose 3,5-epimerase
MLFSPLNIPLVIDLTLEDDRGFFARSFCSDLFMKRDLCTHYPQWSISFNHHRDTVRGLHFQAAPYEEIKLVRCTRGAIFDVLVDLRPGSPTRGKWVGIELIADNRASLYIPAGFAHGFQTLTDDTEVVYHISEPYRPEAARGVRWDDADLAIVWPKATQRVISERDRVLPRLRDLRPTTPTAFHMKDGPENDVIGSRPKRVELGGDEDGDPITSCVIVPIEISETRPIEGPRLTNNQQTMFSILHDAGCLTKERWNERARDVRLGTSRKADLHDLPTALLHKRLVYEITNGFKVRQP